MSGNRILRSQKIDEKYSQNRSTLTPSKQKCDNLFDTEDDWGDGADDWSDSLAESSESFRDRANLMTLDIDENSEKSRTSVSTDNTKQELMRSGADLAAEQLKEMCLGDAVPTNQSERTDASRSSDSDFEAMNECCVEDFSVEPESELLKDLLLGRHGEAEAQLQSDTSQRFEYYYRPQQQLRKGDVFTSICHSVHRREGACVAKRGMCGERGGGMVKRGCV